MMNVDHPLLGQESNLAQYKTQPFGSHSPLLTHFGVLTQP